MIRTLSIASALAVLLAPAVVAAAPAPAPPLYHGAAYYPELWPESEVDRDIERMKALGINVVRIGEFAWSKMEPDEGKIDLRYFVRVMDKLHAAGIRVVFCTPTATPPVWLTDGRPDRAFVNQEGVVMVHGARQHVSYDHPDVRAASFRIVEAIGQAVGRHPSLIAWQIDNEFKCHVAEDFSDASVAAWGRWLQKRYKTIDALNEAWGTEIWSERYQRFDQVPAPRKTPFIHNASLSTAYLAFSREAIADFMDEQSAILRKHSSAPITHNMHLGFATNLERMNRNLDFASFDAYTPASNYARLVMNGDVFRGAKPGKPFWVMETSVAHNGWLGNHEPIHPPGFLAAEIVAWYGLGSEAVSWWLWRQQRTGCELPHSAVISAWGKPTIGYESVQSVEAARKSLNDALRRTRPAPSEVALTWSDRARMFLQTEPLGGGKTFKVEYPAILSAWHKLLLDAGFARDVRFEDAPLDGLKLLVTPYMPHVSEAFRERVTAWMKTGGVWIAGPVTGARTAEHTVPTDAALGPLEALAGVETVFSFPITGAESTGTAWNLKAPLSGWCHAFKAAAPEVKVVGTLEGELAKGLGFITERSVGKGAIVMLGADPQGDEGQALLAKLVTHYAERAGVTRRYTVSPGTLVAPRVDDAGRESWLVVNLDGKGGKVDLPKAARDGLTGKPVPAGPLALARYEYRLVLY